MKTLKEYISLDENLLSLNNYILEADEDDSKDDIKPEDEMDQDALDSDKPDGETDNEEDKPDKDKLIRRGKIKFTIWEEPKKKVNWIQSNEKYQKIEYQYISDDKKVEIDFLLGYVPEEKTWKLWIGKIGAITYDDDPWCDFETNKFAEAIVAALDKVEEFIDDVNENPDNWVQFYIS